MDDNGNSVASVPVSHNDTGRPTRSRVECARIHDPPGHPDGREAVPATVRAAIVDGGIAP